VLLHLATQAKNEQINRKYSHEATARDNKTTETERNNWGPWTAFYTDKKSCLLP
jgi:hypothetical protein